MTFCATINAIIHTGARPVLADVSLPEMTLDPDEVRRRITPRTKAIVPVHFHGRPADLDVLRAIADEHGLLLIDDAAHAIETLHRGRHMGAVGDAACFSFYVTKNLTTVEGGMVATRHADWADKIKIYALHGLSRDAWARFADKGYKHYEVVMAGFKYNMTDIQASFGLQQLRRIEERLPRREQIWSAYDDAFRDLPLVLPPEPKPHTRHARHLYAVRTTADSPLDRDALMDALYQRKIGTGVHYTALHLQPFYARQFGCRPGDFPHTEAVGSSTLSLPLSAKLTDEDVDDVIEAVRGCLGARPPA
jgi:dTDP-4-amino-4,6-dideoxygalactose transaminase